MREQFANIIYDTLMNNKQHEQLNLDHVGSDTYIEGNIIFIEYQGKTYALHVNEAEDKQYALQRQTPTT